MKNKIKYIGLFLFVCQTVFGQTLLDKAKQPIAFLNEDVVFSESWISGKTGIR